MIGYGFSMQWILLMVVSTGLGLLTQSYIKSSFRKWGRVGLTSGMTGAQVAQRVLEANGVSVAGVSGPSSEPGVNGSSSAVRILSVGGNLSDNYDPRNKTLNLSEGVYAESSVAAAGVAAHEAGHAVQDAQGYVWGTIRSALVPAVNIGSSLSWVLIMVGIFIQFSGLIWVGVAFFGFAVLFQVVTLPVEFDASRRAVAALESTATLDSVQLAGARQVLTAAALTYVAAAAQALSAILYYVFILLGSGNRRRNNS